MTGKSGNEINAKFLLLRGALATKQSRFLIASLRSQRRRQNHFLQTSDLPTNIGRLSGSQADAKTIFRQMSEHVVSQLTANKETRQRKAPVSRDERFSMIMPIVSTKDGRY
jgi:hypothetical protein